MGGRAWGGLASIADAPAPGLGPLGGVAGALRFARDHGYATVLTIGCDMPDVPADLFARLLRRSPSYCPDAPTLGAWPATLAEPLCEWLLNDEDRSLRGWARAAGAVPVTAPAPLANVNTPADLPA